MAEKMNNAETESMEIEEDNLFEVDLSKPPPHWHILPPDSEELKQLERRFRNGPPFSDKAFGIMRKNPVASIGCVGLVALILLGIGVFSLVFFREYWVGSIILLFLGIAAFVAFLFSLFHREYFLFEPDRLRILSRSIAQRKEQSLIREAAMEVKCERTILYEGYVPPSEGEEKDDGEPQFWDVFVVHNSANEEEKFWLIEEDKEEVAFWITALVKRWLVGNKST